MESLKWIISSITIIFYACAVMYLLLDVHFSKLSGKQQIGGILFFIFFLMLNILAQVVLGYQLYGKFYLLFTQLPVYVLFLFLSKYRGIKLFFVLLSAVFFTSPVMILSSIVRCFFVPSIWFYLLCYFILIVVINVFFKNSFHYMLTYAENSMFFLFTAVPLLYYIYTYALTQYQLADRVVNKQFFIQQIPVLIVLIAYMLLIQIFKIVSEKAEMKNAQNLAAAQLNAAKEQIEQLRTADKQTAIYRHDLRHHMNYLNACISENRLQEAAIYIRQTCENIDNTKVVQYLENESVNLILSSYAGKAKEQDVAISIHVTAVDFSRFQITDLCSLLANALENAIKAAAQSDDTTLRYVALRLYEKSNRLCLELRNGYSDEPVLENNIPVSQETGHGIGVKSIIQVIDKYNGVYGFSAKNGMFCFQMSM